MGGFSEWTHERTFGFPQKGALYTGKKKKDLTKSKEPKQRGRAQLGIQVRGGGTMTKEQGYR